MHAPGRVQIFHTESDLAQPRQSLLRAVPRPRNLVEQRIGITLIATGRKTVHHTFEAKRKANTEAARRCRQKKKQMGIINLPHIKDITI